VRATLALTAATRAELVAALGDPRETAGVLSAQLIDVGGELTLLARSLTWAKPEHYLDRTDDGLQLLSPGWVPSFRRAATAGDIALFVHTHPSGDAQFSEHDDLVDEQLRAVVAQLGINGPYGALLVAGMPTNPNLVARLCTDDGSPQAITRFRVVGDRLDFVRTSGARTVREADETFDRQIRLFGTAGQDILRDLHVGIVGCGGTGSAVAEQLTRLGVGWLTLIDDDDVTTPTPTRGYGIRVEDVGRCKSQVLAADLIAIGLGTQIRAIVAPLHDRKALDALAHADVVFCCVDGHGARLILNRWAYAHHAPVIDLAVLVAADGDVSIDARVTWIAAGSACLLCRGRIDPSIAYAENLDPARRRALAGEGYVIAAESPQPAVVTLTTLVASMATTELLLRLFGIGETEASELLLRPHLHEVRRNRILARRGCFCTDAAFGGRGFTNPYLDLMWT